MAVMAIITTYVVGEGSLDDLLAAPGAEEHVDLEVFPALGARQARRHLRRTDRMCVYTCVCVFLCVCVCVCVSAHDLTGAGELGRGGVHVWTTGACTAPSRMLFQLRRAVLCLGVRRGCSSRGGVATGGSYAPPDRVL